MASVVTRSAPVASIVSPPGLRSPAIWLLSIIVLLLALVALPPLANQWFTTGQI